VHLVYQVDTSKLPDESDETVGKAIEQNIVVINNRVDALGVANPFVARQGRDFIVIQLPGVYGAEEAKSIIGKTALLEFKLVKDDEALVRILDELNKRGIDSDDVVAGRIPDEVKKMIPAGLELGPQREGGYLLLESTAALTGRYLRLARVDPGQAGQFGLAIDFELDGEGAQIFEAFTGAHIGDRLAIVLDGLVQSAPRIESRIPGGRGQITGNFTPQEAKLLSNILNSGNLQAPMTVVEERTVGPELGEDSVRAGARAMLAGLALVLGFMLLYYKFSGLLADIALFLNLVILLAIMTSIGATMTMPGIAGVILSLALSVDANVIILERVREELAKGKDVRVAIEEGYDKAFSAILDGNVTSILAAAFLFQFGTGPVKGFGVTLMWGLIISMFTCVFATKIFYEVWFSAHKPKTLSV
jgi:preprotein translocase subunit SecD